MGGFKEGFLKAGLVSAAQAANVKVEARREGRPIEPGYVEDQQAPALPADEGPLPSADPTEYPEWALKWGAAAVELLGKARLIDALTRGMDGTGRGRSFFDNTVEGAIARKPRAEADAWRTRLPSLGGRKGVPTFEREGQQVLDAVRGGAVDAYMSDQRELAAEAAKLVPPTLNEGEGQDAYRSRLDAWAGEQIEAVLKSMGFDAYRLAATAVEAREKARLERATTTWEEACEVFDQTGDINELLVAERATGGTVLGKDGGRASVYAKYHAAGHAKWAWPHVASGALNPSEPSVPPPADWLAAQSNQDFVLRCSREANCPHTSGRDFRPAFRARLLELSTLKPDTTSVVVRGKVAIDHEGRVIPLSVWQSWRNRDGERRTALSEEQGEKLYSREPSSNGWVSIRMVNEYGSTKLVATLYGPDAFKALQVAQSVKPGCGGTDVRPWLENFGRHPNKGFGRFHFRIQPGGASWDEMIVSVDDRLRDRIELLAKLPDPADAPFAEDVYYVPMRTTRKDRGGHTTWFEGGPRATCYAQKSSLVHMSRRSSGELVTHKTASTAVAWTLLASTRSHNEAMIVAVIGKGQRLQLDTGMVIGFDGAKTVNMPGGVLPPS